MSIIIKVLIGIIVLLFAMNVGFYLSGWLTLLFLGLRGQISLEEVTYLQYLGAIHRPDLAPEAIWIEIAGVLGFGLLFVVWLALMWLMVKYQPEWLRNVSLWEKPPADKNAGQSVQGQPSPGQSVAPGQMAAPDYGRGQMPSQTFSRRNQEQEDMNLKRLAATATLGIAAATVPVLSGCEPKDYSRMQFEHNPHPVEGYLITVRVEGAPGSFRSVEGGAWYDIDNPCLPPHDPYLGAQLAPTSDVIRTNLTQTGANTWSGTVYADGMLDAPYYDRGICHWRFSGMGTHMMATGAKGETAFLASLSAEQVRGEQTVVTYFNKIAYPRDPTLDPNVANDSTSHGYYSYYGDVSRLSYGPDITDADLFTITLSAKKVAP